ncbi:hypothetical protein [Mucilaginibacter psychrotolerans]|uniref:Outer membrane protein beta-barrel domain-containing protein n=1 Tax=Mucilaginibacter psychrotolerans TaxID=1524096 RepID=A0A4Y8S678_9SPHI|nr:hypothetical protein [Mucilaginibacter psychrotolerans]TFF34105.1 hypothetical protein E2R66_23020 [Mucilaginibacter psychrotolerans]
MFKLLPIIALCTMLGSTAFAQKISPVDSLQNSYATKKAQSVYFELLGPGAIYSANYDTRFKNRQDGLGGRIGISYYADGGDQLFTVPVVVNYLLGKKGKYFEVGAGITYFSVNSNTVFFKSSNNYENGTNDIYYGRKNNSGIFGSLNFGYRYQPADGGFMFRGGVSPIITSEQFVPYWPYISFGYCF